MPVAYAAAILVKYGKEGKKDMSFKIGVIRGDGIGPEIVAEALKVMDKVAWKYGVTFDYRDILLGGASIGSL